MILTRLTQYVKDNGIKSGSCKYHTWRDLEDDDGNKKGEIRVMVLDDGIARVEYQCPDCGHQFFEEKPWKRPFNVKCQNCGKLIRVPKMKDQIKKRN